MRYMSAVSVTQRVISWPSTLFMRIIKTTNSCFYFLSFVSSFTLRQALYRKWNPIKNNNLTGDHKKEEIFSSQCPKVFIFLFTFIFSRFVKMAYSIPNIAHGRRKKHELKCFSSLRKKEEISTKLHLFFKTRYKTYRIFL